MENILANRGFEFEMIGGGSHLLSKYLANQSFVMASDMGGMGLPSHGDWLVIAYPSDYDGDYETILFEAYSNDFGGATIFDAIDCAIAILNDHKPNTEGV